MCIVHVMLADDINEEQEKKVATVKSGRNMTSVLIELVFSLSDHVRLLFLERPFIDFHYSEIRPVVQCSDILISRFDHGGRETVISTDTFTHMQWLFDKLFSETPISERYTGRFVVECT